ncbi:hypothetical protein HGG76_07630 [Ochrobactrum tritici]|uniref:Uncharacterized protein n=1 Tax=Brucella tritici TaxID=94626 RepID=A0A7X6FSN3_9HYPH|nr:hypothetical protein [Brucella tritici]
MKLRFFRRKTGTQDHGIEPEKAPLSHILCPEICAILSVPAFQTMFIGRLMCALRFADIVVSRNNQHRGGQADHHFAAEGKIVLDIRAVHADIAGMNDEIGIFTGEPVFKGCQFSTKCALWRPRCVSEICMTRTIPSFP